MTRNGKRAGRPSVYIDTAKLVECMAKGLAVKQIAGQLGVSCAVTRRAIKREKLCAS